MLPYTFASFCTIHHLNPEDYDPPPITFNAWLKEHQHLMYGDFVPELLYDSYVWQLEQQGLAIVGNSSYGIGIKKSC